MVKVAFCGNVELPKYRFPMAKIADWQTIVGEERQTTKKARRHQPTGFVFPEESSLQFCIALSIASLMRPNTSSSEPMPSTDTNLPCAE